MSYLPSPQSMSRPHWFGLIRIPAISFSVMGLLAIALPLGSRPASANDYGTCASSLVQAGITPALAASSCAQALQPTELASCVADIKGQTTATAANALATCVRVRRPLDLASCVVSIDNETPNPAIAEVLDSCRRSLLPVRFAECVVGLSNQVKLAPSAAMGTCIDASDTRASF